MFIVLISVLATCKWLLAICCLLNLNLNLIMVAVAQAVDESR